MSENMPVSHNNNMIGTPSTALIGVVKQLWSDINSSKEYISQLQDENNEFKIRSGEIEKLWGKYNELKAKIPELEDKANYTDSLINENRKLKNENFIIKNQLNELIEIEKNIGFSKQELLNKNILLKENADIIDKLKETIAEHENMFRVYDEKIKVAEAHDFKAEYHQKELDLRGQIQDIIDRTTRENDSFKNEIVILKETIESQEKMLNEYSQKLFDINKSKVDYEKAVKEMMVLKETIKDNEKILDEKSIELKRLSALNVNYLHSIKELEDELLKSMESFEKSEDDKFALMSKVAELSKFKEDNNDKLALIKEMENQLNFIKNLNVTKNKEIIDLRDIIESDKLKITELSKIIHFKDNDIEMLTEQRDKYRIIEEDNKLLRNGCDELKSSIEFLQSNIVGMESESVEKQAKIQQYESELNDKLSEIQRLNGLLSGMNNSITNPVPLVIENNNHIQNTLFEIDHREELIMELDRFIKKLEVVLEQ